MRWLLIALLVLLQIEAPAFGAAVAGSGAMSCHSMPADEAPRDRSVDPGAARLAIHVCPGCAMPTEPQVAAGPAPVTAVPTEPAELLSPTSLNLPPSPPPPRRA